MVERGRKALEIDVRMEKTKKEGTSAKESSIIKSLGSWHKHSVSL